MLVDNPFVITTRPEYFKALGWPENKFKDCQDALYPLDYVDEFQFDTETTGLDSFLKEKINAFQVGLPGVQYIFDAETIPLSILKRPLESKLILMVNGAFDLPYLGKEGIFPTRLYDCYVVERCLTMGLLLPRGSRGLDNLTKKYTTYTLNKDFQKEIAAGLTSVEAIEYSGRDVVPLAAIRDAQMELVRKYGIEQRVREENDFVLTLSYAEFCGIGLDEKAMFDRIRYYEYLEYKAILKLKKFGDIDWGSPKQVGEILEAQGVTDRSEKSGQIKTGKEIINKYKHLPVIKALKAKRDASKQVDTYGRAWLQYAINGRVHTRYKQFTNTGRTSCGALSKTNKYSPTKTTWVCTAPFPNVQQVPKSMREVFIPKRGNKFVCADYSGQEQVIMADQSQEPNLLRFYTEGDKDLHCYVTRIAYPELKDLTDDEIKEHHAAKRDWCKKGSFAIAYGGNGGTVSRNLNLSQEEGDNIFNSYMKAFPGLKDYFKACFEFTCKNGYIPIDPIAGGKRFLNRGREFKKLCQDKDYWRKYWKEKEADTQWYRTEREKIAWFNELKSKVRRWSINSKMQGIGAYMSKRAGNYIYSYIQRNKLHGKFLINLFCHDEWLCEGPEKMLPTIAKVMQASMERAGKECLKTLTIKATPKILDRWTK